MRQTVIRDPGGEDLVRIVPDINSTNFAIVNGSVLIVPPGTTAFVAINGVLSRPYGSGTYSLITGVDPFFVRLRNIMTGGDSATSVAVFFVTAERVQFMSIGTGDIFFKESRFQISMTARANCRFSILIENPLLFLQRIVGTYSSRFDEESLMRCVERIILTPVREALSRELNRSSIYGFNSFLSVISSAAEEQIRTEMAAYGINLDSFSVTEINLPIESEWQRLHKLEEQHAKGIIDNQITKAFIDEVWDGNPDKMAMAGMMTGKSARGQMFGTDPVPERDGGGSGGGMPQMMMQWMMFSKMMPYLQESFSQSFSHTDMFSGNNTNTTNSEPRPNAAPSLPRQTKICPMCNGQIARGNMTCPVCGHIFERRV